MDQDTRISLSKFLNAWKNRTLNKIHATMSLGWAGWVRFVAETARAEEARRVAGLRAAALAVLRADDAPAGPRPAADAATVAAWVTASAIFEVQSPGGGRGKAPLPADDALDVCESMVRKDAAYGEPLFFQGDPAEHMYILLSGSVTLFHCADKRREVQLRMRVRNAAREATAGGASRSGGGVGKYHNDDEAPPDADEDAGDEEAGTVVTAGTELPDDLLSGYLGDKIAEFTADPGGKPVVFGETALLAKRGVRAAAAVVSEMAELLLIPRDAFERALKGAYIHRVGLEDKLAYVDAMPCFARWDDAQRKNLAYNMRLRTFAPRATLATEGAPLEAFYLVVSGDVDVYVSRSKDGGTGTGARRPPPVPFGPAAHTVRVCSLERRAVVDSLAFSPEGVAKTYQCSYVARGTVTAYELGRGYVERRVMGAPPTTGTSRLLKEDAALRRAWYAELEPPLLARAIEGAALAGRGAGGGGAFVRPVLALLNTRLLRSHVSRTKAKAKAGGAVAHAPDDQFLPLPQRVPGSGALPPATTAARAVPPPLSTVSASTAEEVRQLEALLAARGAPGANKAGGGGGEAEADAALFEATLLALRSMGGGAEQ